MSINLSALMKQRYDTAANWTAQNPTLLAGEIGIESDTKKWKVGTGATAWTSLVYAIGGTYPIVNADIAAAAAIVDTKLATIATAGKVSNSATTAASANTASAIVARDASGNFTAGTAALPGIAVSGDLNTGIYSPGADQLAISTNGTQKLIILSDGKTGIGASSPIFLTDILSGTPNTGANVNNPSQLSVTGPNKTLIGGGATFFVNSNSDFAIDNGGSIALSGRNTTSSTNSVVWGVVKGAKENATSTNTAGYLAFASQNHNTGALVEAMRIDSQQRVGIGDSAPESLLHLKGSNATLKIESSVNTGYSGVEFDRAADDTHFAIYAYDSSHASQANNVQFYGYQNGNIQFFANSTERMRITNQGWFKASNNGTYTYAQNLHEFRSNQADFGFTVTNSNASPSGIQIYHITDANGTANQFLFCYAGAALRAEIRSNGGLANYSANNANLSDRNVKKDIALAAGTWDCIKEWEIVNYRYKDQPDDADLNLGVIAQQVAESCPEVITIFQEAKEATEDKPAQEERLGVKEQQMYWMAIKALQEAMERIEQLETEMAAVKAQLV